MVESVAAGLRTREPDWIVRVAHLEIEAPDVRAGIEACVEDGARELIVHPYFIAPGMHTTRDLEALVEEARARHPGVPMRVTAPLGFDERIVDIVHHRVTASRSGD